MTDQPLTRAEWEAMTESEWLLFLIDRTLQAAPSEKPKNPRLGDIWWNLDDHSLWVWNNERWVKFSK